MTERPLTTVVNLRRSKFDVYIGRAGKCQDGYFGNPFTLREHGKAALDKFYVYFTSRVRNDPEFRGRVAALRGKVLGCFCKPGPCHGDVIAEYVNGLERAKPVDVQRAVRQLDRALPGADIERRRS